MRYLLTIILLGVSFSVFAEAKRIAVVGLLPDIAIININGVQHTMREGDTKSGVTLISADSKSATVQIDGKEYQYFLGMDGGSSGEPEEAETVMIPRDSQGMYRVDGSINGKSVNFLVDTGASQVAFSSDTAKALKIEYKSLGKHVQIHTAAGIVHGYTISLTELKVGQVKFNNVPAVVIEGVNMKEILLGMSVLGRMELQYQGNMLYLKQKW